MAKTVLICSEDPELYLLLRYILATECFVAVLATSTADAEHALQAGGILAAIVDTAAWIGDAVALCTLARSSGVQTGALIGPGTTGTYLRMMNAGLDDGIMRPLAPERLLAFLRSAERNNGATGVNDNGFGSGLSVSPDLTRVVVDGRSESVSPTEARILLTLMQNDGKPCSRNEILAAVWPHSEAVEQRTIDVYVGRLRRVLARSDNVRIRTIYGQGYALLSARP
jgi:two-component system phosphate regulon response regulator PhoB